MPTSRSPLPPADARRRPRSARLSRAGVIDVAMRAAERGELDRLTMRAIADELGVTAMSLYSHVADKDDLLDEVIERLLSQVGLPDINLDWRDWMCESADRLRELFRVQPALLDRYRRRPVGVPAALRRMEAGLDVLARAGFSGPQAVELFAAVHTYTIGFASLATSRDTNRWRQRLGASFDEASPGYWPAFFAALDSGAYPRLTELQPDLAAFTGADFFSVGLTAILDGFAARITVR